jgi:hypothetical protein
VRPTRAVPGRLYQDERGAFWIGLEDGRFGQASVDGFAKVPHYLHHFVDVEAAQRRSTLSTEDNERQKTDGSTH